VRRRQNQSENPNNFPTAGVKEPKHTRNIRKKEFGAIYCEVADEDTAKATALQCRLAVRLTLHDCSLDAKCN
jgi:hypothetical protein